MKLLLFTEGIKYFFNFTFLFSIHYFIIIIVVSYNVSKLFQI